MIRVERCVRCLVCGAEGSPLYQELPDLMLGTPGRWTLVACQSAGCGLLWLDPRPVGEDLGELYKDYFTHQSSAAGDGRGGFREKVAAAIRQRLLGYPAGASAAVHALSALISLVPWHRASALRDLFWLHARDRGLLLDIGCGNGEPMRRFVQAGWDAVGLDADAQAVAAALSAGLDARVGTLSTQRFPDARFDAILMSHVIEHLPDPLSELRECRRILKPSGSIVIATPNARGLGHRIAGRHWRGLEPPRHLRIFTPAALTRMLAAAGFHPIEVRTHAGATASWLVASRWWKEAEAAGRLAERQSGRTPIPGSALFLARLEAIGIVLGVAWGDEIVARYAPV